jgi:hypothetical protein
MTRWDEPGADPLSDMQRFVDLGREHLPGGALHRIPSPPWICDVCNDRLTAGESLTAPDLDADGSRCYFCGRRRTDLRVVADAPAYDPDEGQVVLSRWIDGTVRDAVLVRKGLEEKAIREAVILELQRLGYTVTPPEMTP